MLPIHTYDDIMSISPCYDPAERGVCERDWQGTALDVLHHSDVSAQDKLWLVTREDWIPAPLLHEFGCRLAEQALALIDDPDPCCAVAIEVKRAWVRGELSKDELYRSNDRLVSLTKATSLKFGASPRKAAYYAVRSALTLNAEWAAWRTSTDHICTASMAGLDEIEAEEGQIPLLIALLEAEA